ncbi:MAG TPA: TlyA family RNA methyltransferase [Candidatus Xenobia bacterium]|nr:TlyA family RNA methyltransferase [Candidatus Xenobia bacterium]
MARIRLDRLVVERGLAPTREKAQALILAGQIHLNGRPATKAGLQVSFDARVELLGEPQRYVSRGGIKLEGALRDFDLDVRGKVCLDIGASTGGFTDCLLQRGAARVYAVDVGRGQLDWKLRQDKRVIVREGLNARYLKPEDLGETVDVTTIDVAFISVEKILPAVVRCARPGADFLILIKPQFELTARQVGKGGIVRDPELQQQAVEKIRRVATALGLEPLAVRESRLPGAEGNREFFLHARVKASV